jgi:AcrR family transcriptional regulator
MAHENYHHGDLRAALIQSGLELIREVGADAFTLREAARRSNVSHTAPYRHFRDKSELLAAIAEEGFELLAKEMRRAGETKGTAVERLVRAGRAYVDFALRRPEHFKVMFAARLDPERHPAARHAADEAFGGLVALVIGCQQAKEVRALPPLTVARIAWSQVHGIATLASGGQFQLKTRADVLAFAEQAMDALIEGLR